MYGATRVVRAGRWTRSPGQHAVPELLAYAKANPDKMTFASADPACRINLFIGGVQENDG